MRLTTILNIYMCSQLTVFIIETGWSRERGQLGILSINEKKTKAFHYSFLMNKKEANWIKS
jgi:hypothetical protein